MKKTILISVLISICAVINLNAQEKQVKKESKDSEVTLSVKMHCNDCAEKVKKQLAFDVKGVKEVTPNLEKQEVKVKYRNDKTDSDKLIESLSKIGYDAKIATPGCCANKKSSCCTTGKKEGSCSKTKKQVNSENLKK